MQKTVLAALVLLATSCATFTRNDAERTVAEVLVSDQQEFQLGLQVHEELKKENTKFSENQQVGVYVEQMAKKLTAQADKDRPGVTWQYYVIDDPKTVNAFATPGGRIYVYTGLLLAAQNEAEVIGVLGHEIGHVVARHSARQLVAQKGIEVVSNMALGKNAGEVATLATALTGKGALLAYGRGHELEADEYGARYSNGIGYDPHGLITFFTRLSAGGQDPGILVWLSTHPSNTERIDKLKALITEKSYTATNLGTNELKTIQAALGAK